MFDKDGRPAAFPPVVVEPPQFANAARASLLIHTGSFFFWVVFWLIYLVWCVSSFSAYFVCFFFFSLLRVITGRYLLSIIWRTSFLFLSYFLIELLCLLSLTTPATLRLHNVIMALTTTPPPLTADDSPSGFTEWLVAHGVPEWQRRKLLKNRSAHPCVERKLTILSQHERERERDATVFCFACRISALCTLVLRVACFSGENNVRVSTGCITTTLTVICSSQCHQHRPVVALYACLARRLRWLWGGGGRKRVCLIPCCFVCALVFCWQSCLTRATSQQAEALINAARSEVS
jgi:hypothetical protein